MLFGISTWTLSIQIKHSASTWSVTWVRESITTLYLLKNTLFGSSLSPFSHAGLHSEICIWKFICQSTTQVLHQTEEKFFHFCFYRSSHPHQQPAVSIQTLSSSCVLGLVNGFIWITSFNKASKVGASINAGEGVEKREPSYTVGGNAN